MDLRHLQTFQTVLREGSFLRAARALRLAQPTVTLHIQELERELGLELFDRRGRRRQQTPAGELLAQRALPILDSLDALGRSLEELREGRSGLLRLGSIEPAASRRLMPLLGRLRAQRPGLRVRLEIAGTGGVSRGVADAVIDVGLCSAPPAELGLRFEPLFDEEIVLLLPRAHRLARKRSLVARDLEGEPLALTEQGCAYRRRIEASLQERGVRPQWALECGSAGTLRSAVRHGLGVAVLPRLTAEPAPPGTVVRRLSDLPLALSVGLVSRPESAPPTPALAALIASLRREAADRPHPDPPS
jgi:DNA-binding transcriptional LysR family regulator